ncbi:hypothetical protein BDZ89DRAFT_1151296 [Hymenopellis radicata]|nr:hypothetical protein BDZ89DRAFT_1151296 [Hymenopellis radicata]
MPYPSPATRHKTDFVDEVREIHRFHYGPREGEVIHARNNVQSSKSIAPVTAELPLPWIFYVSGVEGNLYVDPAVSQILDWESFGYSPTGPEPIDIDNPSNEFSFMWEQEKVINAPTDELPEEEPMEIGTSVPQELEEPIAADPRSLLERMGLGKRVREEAGPSSGPKSSPKKSFKKTVSEEVDNETDEEEPHSPALEDPPEGTLPSRPDWEEDLIAELPPVMDGYRPDFIVRIMPAPTPPGVFNQAIFRNFPAFPNLTRNWMAFCTPESPLILLAASGDVTWNEYWLSNAVLRCPPSTTTVLKIWANVFPTRFTIGALLTMALRHNLKFSLKVDKRTRFLEGHNLQEGYREISLPKDVVGRNFIQAWMQCISDIAKRLHMRAVVGEAGVYTWIMAQWTGYSFYDDYMSGPSVLLTHHMLGGSNSRAITRNIPNRWEQITESEKSLLIGSVLLDGTREPRSLYPPQELLENSWFLQAKIWNRSCDRLMTFITDRIEAGNWEAHNKREWIRLFQSMSRQERYQMEYVPTENDLAYGVRLMRHAYPNDWNGARIAHINIPEKFEGQARG